MIHRGSALAITLTLALAAVRLTAPTSSRPAASGEFETRFPAPPGSAPPPTTSGIGPCTAYSPAAAAPAGAGAPFDENRGAAQKLLRSFFGSDTPPDTVRYAIALAPDPRHTNLSLMFDREISVVQQAAQDQGYEYNSSWMPWRADARQPLDALGDRQYAASLTQAREVCPGVMLFRKSPTRNPAEDELNRPARYAYDSALVVFVIGEQATGGLNEAQWKTTVDWLRNKKSDDRMLRILGPTFTGSLVSLERDLNAIYAPPGDAPFAASFPAARIFSGSVSDCSVIHWFERQLPNAVPHTVDFGTFEENDALQIFRFLEYMHSQGVEPQDVAILSEDETAYAALRISHAEGNHKHQADPAREKAQETVQEDSCDFPYSLDNRPMHLVYPRDISALRDAYQRQAVFDSSGNSLKETPSHPILRDITGQESPNADITDTIPSFSGDLSAVAQEAYLYGVVSFLRAHHSKFLLLRCTNPLDVLFLTRFFHRAYPQARIVTLGTDLLFRREIDTTEFRGVLALTSYPLLPTDQHWSRITADAWESDPHNHLVFESSMQEGMYLAARYLLQPKATSGLNQVSNAPDSPLILDRTIPTADYANPFWLHPASELPGMTNPPVWLVAVGRDGYWPLAVLNGELHQNLEKRLGWQAPGKASTLSRWLTSLRSRLQPGWKPALGDDTAKAATIPPSTLVELVAPHIEPVVPSYVQHYELKANDADPTVHDADHPTYSSNLLLRMPLPWLVCLIMASILVLYQVWGIYRANRDYVSNGLFSVFQKVPDRSQVLLLSMNCALAVMPLLELTLVRLILPDPTVAAPAEVSLNWSTAISMLVLLLTGLLLIQRWRKRKTRALAAFACYLIPVGLLCWMYMSAYKSELIEANGVPLFYRIVHVTDGVSPLIPCLLLTLGFYLWTWQTLAGNLMLTRGCPTLPSIEMVPPQRWKALRRFYHSLLGYRVKPTGIGTDLLPRSAYRISQGLGRNILKVANPLCVSFRIIAIPFLLFLAFFICFGMNNLALLSLEGKTFNLVLNLMMLLALLMTGAEAARLYFTWMSLRKLLHALSRLRLKRTIAGLRPIDSHTIWSVSGNVRRFQYRLFVQQMDALKRLIQLTHSASPLWLRAIAYGQLFSDRAEAENGGKGTLWEEKLAPPGMAPLLMRDVLADAVADAYRHLEQEWRIETNSLNLDSAHGSTDDAAEPTPLPLSKHASVRAAEEFVAYHYMVFIQNVIARMRTIALSMIVLFVTVCFAISFYPFVPRTEIAVWMVLNLALIGSTVAYVYAGIERNEILSYMANTNPGKLGSEFWIKLASFLAAPVIGILTTQFPSITDTVLQWLQPGLDAIK